MRQLNPGSILTHTYVSASIMLWNVISHAQTSVSHLGMSIRFPVAKDLWRVWCGPVWVCIQC